MLAVVNTIKVLMSVFTTQLDSVSYSGDMFLRNPKTNQIETIPHIIRRATLFIFPPMMLLRRFYIPFADGPKLEKEYDEPKEVPSQYFLDLTLLGTLPAIVGSIFYPINYFFYQEYIQLIVLTLAWFVFAFTLPSGHFLFTVLLIITMLNALRVHLMYVNQLKKKISPFAVHPTEIKDSEHAYAMVHSGFLMLEQASNYYSFEWLWSKLRQKYISPKSRVSEKLEPDDSEHYRD